MESSSVDFGRLALNDESQFEIDVKKVGDRGYPLLILDNLYREPDYVRDVALSITPEPPNSSHPGVRSRIQTDISRLHEIAWKHVGEFLGYTPEQAISRSVFDGLSFMRINRKPEDLTIHQCRPHADPVRIAGVIYLNPNEQCRGGTAFYRHRASNVEECVLPRNAKNDPFEKQFIAHAKSIGAFDSYRGFCEEKFQVPYLDFVRSILTTIPREKNYPLDSDEDWELTQKVEMKFNRFICYPGFLIHSGYYRHEWFGETKETQRLTQNVFVG